LELQKLLELRTVRSKAELAKCRCIGKRTKLRIKERVPGKRWGIYTGLG
jgi:hypothetical protein